MVPISEDRCKGYKVWEPSHTQDRAWLVERAQSVMVSYYPGAFEDLIDALTLGNFSAREVNFYEDKDIMVQRSHHRRHEASQLSVLWCTLNSETTPRSEQKPFPPVSWIQVWIGHTIGQRILLNLLTFPSAKGSASALLDFCPKTVHLENILHPFVMYEHWDLIKQGWMKLYQAVLTGVNSGICFCDLGNQPYWKIETPPESAALSSKPSLSSCCGSLVLGQGRPGIHSSGSLLLWLGWVLLGWRWQPRRLLGSTVLGDYLTKAGHIHLWRESVLRPVIQREASERVGAWRDQEMMCGECSGGVESQEIQGRIRQNKSVK